MRSRQLLLPTGAVLLIFIAAQTANALDTYVVMSSSVTYNSSTNKVTGVSQASMDYWAVYKYHSKVKAYIYTTNPATPLTSVTATGGVGQSVVTVQTQITPVPGTQYNLRAENSLLPNDVYYGQFYDWYNFYYVSPPALGVSGQYGPSQTIAACQFGSYCYLNIVYDWIWLGNTNTSLTTPGAVTITNSRISGNLAGHTKNALVGALVTLAAAGTPASGSYSWTFTGSPTIVFAGTNQPSVSVRWTQIGTFTATVTYTYQGGTATSSLNVNNLIPSLTYFAGDEVLDQVNRDAGCSEFSLGSTYTLGCFKAPFFDGGITWTAIAEIPDTAYLTDPAESGIKFKQAVSAYRKRLRAGNLECWTRRSNEGDIDSGWQLDTSDPYNNDENPPRYFSSGPQLIMTDFDAPGAFLDGEWGGLDVSDDAQRISDTFELYVFYFTGNDPTNPIYQRAIGLQGSTSPYARLSWSWGGNVIFHFSQPSLYQLISNTNDGHIEATPANILKSMSTNALSNQWNICPGARAATLNPIDDSKFFVYQMYQDFLDRPPDPSGWNYWRTLMTECQFDFACINTKRIQVARAFFYSGEFINAHPELGGQRGTHAYNSAFVLWCYRAFLRREPNAPPDNNWIGYNFWVGELDSSNPDTGDWKYNNVINAFLLSGEYRGRQW